VADVAPELVVYDDEGQPFSVRYHLLAPLLLNEVQKQQREIHEQQLRGREQQQTIERQQRAIEMLLARTEQLPVEPSVRWLEPLGLLADSPPCTFDPFLCR